MATKNKQKDSNKLKIDRKIAQLENKQRKMNADRVITNNSLKESKDTVLKGLFDKMKIAGVDLNDAESINNFLQSIGDKDPDLLILLENAMKSIMQESPENEQELVQEGADVDVAGSKPLFSLPNIQRNQPSESPLQQPSELPQDIIQ